MQKSLQPDIWIIDDLEPDQEILRIALNEVIDLGRLKSFYSAEDALEAIRSGYQVKLILLDLQMPGIGGRGFLKEISEQSLIKIPIIVYTSSNHPDDIRYSYEHGASAFVAKPPDLNGLTEMIRSMGSFWFKHVLLPPG